jgi:small subunit ribosomal protein S2
MGITIHDLLEAGVHFGHQTRRWNPKMKSYIFGNRNGIHIFDLGKSMVGLNNACKFLYEKVAKGGDVLWVGTKRQAQELVKEAAERSGQHAITQRWMGGTLTNIETIRKSVAKLSKFRKWEEDGTLAAMKKKEAGRIRREAVKLESSISGIMGMGRIPSCIVVIDTVKEHLAIKEANALGIPVVAILDTNSDPDLVQYGIPGNDDAVRSLQVLIGQLSEACYMGKGISDKHNEERKATRSKDEGERKARADKGEQAPRGERRERAPAGDRAPRAPAGDRAPRAPAGDRAPRAPAGDRAPRAAKTGEAKAE